MSNQHQEFLKKSASKIFQILTEAYREETLPCAHVFEWYKRFSGERVSVEDDEPAGRPRIRCYGEKAVNFLFTLNVLIRQAGRRAVLLSRWIVRSRPLEIVESSGHEKVPTSGNPCLERPGTREERGSKDRVASTCGPHSDSFNDTSRRRRSNCSTNNFQTLCRSKS
ncbi:hypothetical protein TNCV_4325391 [Trichonephila clavipes]|nr:hypothetical protein TNCV_4325391 [Trichonephila clavipes]